MTTRPSADQVQRLTTPAEPYLSCEDCFDLMDVVVDRVVSAQRTSMAELPRLRAHLGACRACAEEVDSLLELVCDDAGIDSDRARESLGLNQALPSL